MIDPARNGAGQAEGLSTPTPSSLLQRVQANEQQAWQRLVTLYGPLVYGWCLQAGLQPEDAADVGQDVFVAVARKVAHFRRDRPGDSFRGWLWTITSHKISDLRKTRGRRIQAEGGSTAQQRLAQLPEAPSSAPASAPASGESRGLYRHALTLIQAEFAERTWKAFWLLAVEGCPAAAVAADLGMSVGAVYVAKSRVLRRLREEFRDLLSEEDCDGPNDLSHP
jgi:RNA polymerase sigma-70 factor (ECF subfamily)